MADIDWRHSEMATLRTLPFRYGLSEAHKDFLIRYSIPIIYSLWEGFVKTVFEIYVREINNLDLSLSQINTKLLAHAIDSDDKLNLNNSRVSFNTKTEFTEYLLDFLDGSIQISPVIPTESNIDFKVLTKVLERFNLEGISKKYERPLRKLLKFRNSVSHGDNSIPVSATDVEISCGLINDLMSEISNILKKGLDEKNYAQEETD